MRTRLDRQPDGCWVLWEADAVVAEGRWWPAGLLVAVWWWAAMPRPEYRY
jgi:hypothetical protein